MDLGMATQSWVETWQELHKCRSRGNLVRILETREGPQLASIVQVVPRGMPRDGGRSPCRPCRRMVKGENIPPKFPTYAGTDCSGDLVLERPPGMLPSCVNSVMDKRRAGILIRE